MATYLYIARRALKQSLNESDKKSVESRDGHKSAQTQVSPPRSTKKSVDSEHREAAPKAPYAPYLPESSGNLEVGQCQTKRCLAHRESPRVPAIDAGYDPEGSNRLATGDLRSDRLWNDYSYLDDDAVEYLTSPLAGIARCAWCGRHAGYHTQPVETHPGCVVYRWQPTMPFGKHKGRLIHELGSTYLRHIRRLHEQGEFFVGPEVRTEIDRVLSERRQIR